MPTQDERSAATRRLIIDAAAEHFASAGYDATAMNAIADTAGVSKSAVYHHFPDKRSIMVAVYEEFERALAARLSMSVRGEVEPIRAIRRGCHEFLRACVDAKFRRIILVEAPAALGWEEWRTIDSRFGLGLLRAGVTAAIEAEQLPPLDADATAHVLLATMMEGALLVGRSKSPKRALRGFLPVFDAVLDGLVTQAVQPQR